MAFVLTRPRPGRRVLGGALCAAALCVLCAGGPEAQSPDKSTACSAETKERVVSVADVHGAYDKFVAILKEAGLIDKDRHWSGGKAIFVQTGDIMDRGPDSRKALDLLHKLEDEAQKAGGHVYDLLGNHEVMRMIGDRRYVSDEEYKAFRSVDSLELRDAYYEKYLAAKMNQASKAGEKINQGAVKKKFEEETPLGSVEMQQAFAPQGEYGQWLRGHDAMAIVNGVAYLHAGASAAAAAMGCAKINATVHEQLQTPMPPGTKLDDLFVTSSTGPLWYRGLVLTPEGHEGPGVTDAEFDGILKALGVRMMVVGHTVTMADHKIHALYGARLFQADTGMLGDYGKKGGPVSVPGLTPPDGWWPGGQPSALEILGGTVTAIYLGGKREVLVEGPHPATH